MLGKQAHPSAVTCSVIRNEFPGKQLDNMRQNSNCRKLSYGYICTLFHKS